MTLSGFHRIPRREIYVRGLFAVERARLSFGNERYRYVTMRIVATRNDNSVAIN